MTPVGVNIEEYIFGYQHTAVLGMALDMGVFDGNWTAGSGTQDSALSRHILRCLGDMGLAEFSEVGWVLTSSGSLLSSDDAMKASLRYAWSVAFPNYARLQIASVWAAGSVGASSFYSDVFADPRKTAAYAKMLDLSSPIAGLVELLSGSLSGTVVDLGGGDGELIFPLLRENDEASGILLERRDLLEGLSVAVPADLAGRCEVKSGDFWEFIPAGDIFILCRVLANWPDKDVNSLLSRVRMVAKPCARLIVCEFLAVDSDGGGLRDLDLQVNFGGRTRSVESWRECLAGAGWTMADLFRLGEGPEGWGVIVASADPCPLRPGQR